MNIEERFWSKTETSTEHFYNGTPCIDWVGGGHGGGYGSFRFNGIPRLAHRVSYQLNNGTIPQGLCVLHHCDRRCCVNPDHLFIGTNKDNVDDRVTKGRSSRPFGSSNGRAVLTEDIVLIIKQFLHRHPLRTGRAGGQCFFLARWFGVSRAAISKINTGKRWAHLKAEGVAS